jgi:hypothetical protein
MFQMPSTPAIATRLCRILFLVLIGCAAAAYAAPPERVGELAPDDHARLQRGRVLIQRYLADDNARALYLTVPGKLGTLRAIMKIEAIHPARKDLLEAMGVVIGDTFVQDMGFHWVVIEDRDGRHVVIRYRRSNIFLFPLNMLAERVARGERIDVLDLYNDVAADVEQRIEDGAR